VQRIHADEIRADAASPLGEPRETGYAPARRAASRLLKNEGSFSEGRHCVCRKQPTTPSISKAVGEGEEHSSSGDIRKQLEPVQDCWWIEPVFPAHSQLCRANRLACDSTSPVVRRKALRPHHDVVILTSCAQDYVTWRNVYSAGATRIGPMNVLRFPVARQRNLGRLADISKIVDTLDILVFPQANPDGRYYSMNVEEGWRKNRRPAPAGSPHCSRSRGRSYWWSRSQRSCSTTV
jgi:hypothetical protein